MGVRMLVIPQGWDALECHLIEWHGLEVAQANALDADAARRLHAYHHRERVKLARAHEHVG